MKNKKLGILLGGTLAVILTIGGFLYFSNQSKKNLNGTGISGYILGTGVAPDLTPEEIQEMLNKQVDESKVTFSVYSEPTFNGRKGVIMFANPKNSAHNIALDVELNGKTIIKTDKIAPNQYIEEIELIGKALKKGEHKATGLITAYRKDDDKIVGQVAVEMLIKSE